MDRRQRLTPARALLYGTLVVGTLDGIDAFVFFGLRSGTTPIRIFQSIASGWIGRAAYAGGPGVAALGTATWPALPVLANGVLIHMFGVGLPAALFAARARL